jgi:hypothetical protein
VVGRRLCLSKHGNRRRAQSRGMVHVVGSSIIWVCSAQIIDVSPGLFGPGKCECRRCRISISVNGSLNLAPAQIASSSGAAADVSAGVVERGASVHLSCEFFDSGDVGIRGGGAPGQGESGAPGVVVVDEAVGGDTAGLRKGDPCVDVVVVALAGEAGELADGEHGVAVLA